MPDQLIEDAGHDPRPQIVSVNSRGGTETSLAGRVSFGLLVLALLFVGAVYGVNRYRAAMAADQVKTAQAQKVDKPSGGQPGRRVFSTVPPLPAGEPARSPPAGEAQNSGEQCSDGSPGLTLTGADGKPITAADGRLLRVCGNGQATVSPLPGAPASPAAGAAATAIPHRTSRYAGDILLTSHHDGAKPSEGARAPTAPAIMPAEPAAPPTPQSAADANGRKAPMLKTAAAIPVRASMLGDRDMILPQDRSIDCNLSMRLVSEISGRAVCVLSSYVYGDSGRVVLLEPGTVASGEYTAMMAQGQRRLFVLWTRLKTPQGVVIDLDSPAADALGTAGLDGMVDNRWPERIGAAFLLSLVQDAIGYQTARAASGNGNGSAAAGIAVFQHSTETGDRFAGKVLDSTINIKPSIYKQPGDRATITVAHDLDFGSVYELRRK